MDLRTAAGAFGAGRALFGLGYLVAPQRGGRAWVGDPADGHDGELAFRSIGARDLALGAGAAYAAARENDDGAAAWLAAHAISDVADLAGTFVAWDRLPRRGRRLAVVFAGGSAVVSAGLAAALALRD